jgi:hypothetical protein
MPIPSEIQDAVARLNQELEETEQEAILAIDKVRSLLSSFPDNVLLASFFAALNNTLLFVEISRRRIQITINRISGRNVTASDILEVGEDLGTELGRVLEAKMSMKRISDRLRDLQ